MEKIIIQKPVFYQESPFKPLYQLMAYFPGTKQWVMHNVVGGSEGIQVIDIDFDKVGHDITRFNTVKDDFIEKAIDTADALIYLSQLEIQPAVDILDKIHATIYSYTEAAATASTK
jgi:hypothetical protein